MLCNKCRNEGEGKHIIMLWIVSCASFLGSVPRCDAHGTFMRMLEPFGWIILAQGPSMCLLRTLVEPTHYAQSLCVLSFTPFLFGPPRLQRQSSALHLFIHLHRIHLTHPHLTYDRNAPQKIVFTICRTLRNATKVKMMTKGGTDRHTCCTCPDGSNHNR